ncbi:GPW/gp25 family protein [Asticcacaulis endophyticus]|nr:GPW/gp25 family protein [Asticcacaulis endophyticus]
MDRKTGKRIEGLAHIAQSIGIILTTPLGSCPMRRTFGSLLYRLLDAPGNPKTRLLICAASAGAIAKWEPRVRITRIVLSDATAAGRLTLTIDAKRIDVPTPTDVSLQIPLTGA